jgi:hypothetical protein
MSRFGLRSADVLTAVTDPRRCPDLHDKARDLQRHYVRRDVERFFDEDVRWRWRAVHDRAERVLVRHQATRSAWRRFAFGVNDIVDAFDDRRLATAEARVIGWIGEDLPAALRSLEDSLVTLCAEGRSCLRAARDAVDQLSRFHARRLVPMAATLAARVDAGCTGEVLALTRCEPETAAVTALAM